jgi:hypothetical protein
MLLIPGRQESLGCRIVMCLCLRTNRRGTLPLPFRHPEIRFPGCRAISDGISLREGSPGFTDTPQQVMPARRKASHGNRDESFSSGRMKKEIMGLSALDVADLIGKRERSVQKVG